MYVSAVGENDGDNAALSEIFIRKIKVLSDDVSIRRLVLQSQSFAIGLIRLSKMGDSQSRLPNTLHRSILGPKNVMEINETDDHTRQATFYLYYRPLESMPVDAKPLTHWAVVVEFVEAQERVFTFEAGAEEKNSSKIIATRSMEYPTKHDKGRLNELGTKCVSPKQLLEYAQQVSLNGQSYDLIFRNCQAWCKEFCRKISKGFMKDMYWDSKNFSLVLAVSAAVSSSVLSPGRVADASIRGSTIYYMLPKTKNNSKNKKKDE